MALQVGSSTRPRVLLSLLDQPGPHGIEIDIRATLQQMAVVRNQQTLEPILPEMARVAIFALVGQGIA